MRAATVESMRDCKRIAFDIWAGGRDVSFYGITNIREVRSGYYQNDLLKVCEFISSVLWSVTVALPQLLIRYGKK